MTKLNIPGEAANTTDKREAERRAFMQGASQAALQLAPVVTAAVEEQKLEAGKALVAILLFASAFARKAGGTLADFMSSAEQAFGDSEELFASGVIEVLQATRALISRAAGGWCQGELAMKWVRDSTQPDGRRITNCHVKDQYASRWSLLGAVDACADADSNRSKARDALVFAIRDAGWAVKPGSLPIAVITEYNDHGYLPTLPQKPIIPADASPELAAAIEAQWVDTQKQWPQPVANPRTREQVLAVIDRAIELSR